MTQKPRLEELLALKEIAETLNASIDMQQTLHAVLVKLLEVTGLTTGWIFLVGEEPEYVCVVDHNLPPALTWQEKAPMCQGECWCLERYWTGKLHRAVNIINCKRIENAIEYQWGDTQGISHHATVPLEAAGEMFGILNVAAPEKLRFNERELALLQSVAYQIGTAIKRTKLYHTEQRRAENFTKLGEVTRAIGAILQLERIPSEVVKQVGEAFWWSAVTIFVREGDTLTERARFEDGKVKIESKTINPIHAGIAGRAFLDNQVVMDDRISESDPAWKALDMGMYGSAVAIPLRLREDMVGVLLVNSQKKHDFDEADRGVLQALGRSIGMAIENAQLYERRREIATMEERNRLARDLHDTVSQMLFSLSYTARGVESLLVSSEQQASPAVLQSVQDMQQLAHDALKEMRFLIWQLRPSGLQQRLHTALKQYGTGLGLDVAVEVEGTYSIPRSIEETLWRIGQESLNNISKHANTDEVDIRIRTTKQQVTLTISDTGSGFVVGETKQEASLGLTSMRERAELVGGTIAITSAVGQGTKVEVQVPLPPMEDTEKRSEDGED